jgi:hypothetical protein
LLCLVLVVDLERLRKYKANGYERPRPVVRAETTGSDDLKRLEQVVVARDGSYVKIVNSDGSQDELHGLLV